MDGGVGLDGEEVGRLDRPVAADTAEIVANEIDDHGVLGAVLLGRGELAGEPRVVFSRRASRSRPLDRAALGDAVCVEREEALRRRGDDRPLRQIQEGCERRGVRATELVEERPCLAARERSAQRTRQADLERVAGRDVLLRDRDAIHVLGRGEARLDAEGAPPVRVCVRALAWHHAASLGQCSEDVVSRVLGVLPRGHSVRAEPDDGEPALAGRAARRDHPAMQGEGHVGHTDRRPRDAR